MFEICIFEMTANGPITIKPWLSILSLLIDLDLFCINKIIDWKQGLGVNGI